MALVFGFSWGWLSTSSVQSVGIVTFLAVKLWEPSFHPVHGPFGVLELTECLFKVVHFLLEELWLVAHSFGPVGKSINYTILG